MRFVVVAMVLCAALAAGAAHAQDRLDALAAAVDRAAGTPRGEAAIVDRMAAVLSLTPERVRVARVETRLGWGDLFIAQRLASRGGHPLEKVAVARRTGAGWSEIAEEARVDPSALAGDVAAAWPDIARSVPATPPPAAAGAGTTPAPSGAAAAPPAPPRAAPETARERPGSAPEPTPADDIRDRMIRGGGTRR
jgi:hypothetical protein